MPSSRMSSGSKNKEPSTKLEEPCSFNKIPDGPHTEFFIIFWVQKHGIQI
jgi:hypothetical protein